MTTVTTVTAAHNNNYKKALGRVKPYLGDHLMHLLQNVTCLLFCKHFADMTISLLTKSF